MITFIKAQGSSLIATLVDFLFTIVLVEIFGMWYATANVVGLVSGGATNFIINRDWVFNGPQHQLWTQVIRYFIVWCGNILLNTAGVYFVTRSIGMNYIISKMAVSLLVGWSYNYLLQKNFVFKKADHVS